MVLGLKKKKGISVQVDYIVSILEIKPWPPSVSLCSVHSVLIQWENGDQNSGFLPPGVPSLNGFDDGRIEFNEFFKLPVTFCTSKKSSSSSAQNNVMAMGTTTTSTTTTTTTTTTTAASAGDLNFQKNYLEFSLYEPRKEKAVKGQLLGTATLNLSEYGIIKEGEDITVPINIKKTSKGMVQPMLHLKIQPFDNEGIESVLRLMSEHGDDDSEFTSSLTDDEAAITPSSTRAAYGSFHADASADNIATPRGKRMFQSARWDTSSGLGSFSFMREKDRKETGVQENNNRIELDWSTMKQQQRQQQHHASNNVNATTPPEIDVFGRFSEFATTAKKQTSRSNTLKFGRRGLDLQGVKLPERLRHMKSVRLPSELQISHPFSPLAPGPNENNINNNYTVQESPPPPPPPPPAALKVQEKGGSEKKEKKSSKIDALKAEFEMKIQMLQEELKEAAVVEIGLYTVVAEHVNSNRKVHAPARRLSRFYRHACKSGLQLKRASAARTIVSGLVLVSKACGNDVTRLSFWLSNTVVLRAIISEINKEVECPVQPIVVDSKKKASGKKTEKKSRINDSVDGQDDEWENPVTFISALEKIEAWIFTLIVESLWWQSFSPHMQTLGSKKRMKRMGSKKNQKWRFGLGDQEQGKFSIELWKKAFQDASEKLCPIRAGGHDCRCLPMLSKMVMEQLVNRLDVAMFNAILRDSEEDNPADPVSNPITDPKVLPVPAGKSSFGSGAQLKNAVGSWSCWLTDFFHGDENNSPKVSDESDQKKHDEADDDGERFKAFRILSALGDLMMLPVGMLSDGSIRKEVCPLLAAPLIKRVLKFFVPDDFSPNPIPESLLEALDSEDKNNASEDAIKTFPCTANPVCYSPVPISLISGMIERDQNNNNSQKNQQKDEVSSIFQRSYNSDDDLDKMNAPFASISVKSVQISSALSKINLTPKGRGGRNVVRYQLLQEVWKDNNGA